MLTRVNDGTDVDPDVLTERDVARPARVREPEARVRTAMSAGGVVYRAREGIIEVVLVARPADGLWALPKGTPEVGESVEQTALREVREETGLAVVIAGTLGSIRYRYTLRGGMQVQKTVHHYLMREVGGDLSLHDHEYEVAAWVDIHEATGRVSYGNERAILERANTLIQEMS